MAKTQTFEELVREAARVERNLRVYDSPKASRLTAKAFAREAMKNASATTAMLDGLEKWLNPDNAPACISFVTSAVRFITDTSTGVITRPPKDARRLAFLGRDAAIAELSGSKFNIMTLFALAARQAAKKHPNAFGDIEDAEQFDKDRERLQALQQQLRPQLATAWTPADLRFEPHGHLARVTFALTAGAVDVYPTDTAPERLMNWAVQTNLK